jgi:hypothetical protein
MALARARSSCVGGSTACSEVPRMNLLDLDFWNTTDLTAGPSVLVDLRYGGAAGITTPAPTSAGCQLAWSSTCRIVINYETHIHPLWQKTRQVTDTNGVVLADHTCTNCHAPANAQGVAQIPAGQLDLSGGGTPADRDQTTQHVNAYTELVTGGNTQQVDPATGALVFVTILVDSGDVDPVTGAPILVPQQVPEPARIAPLSARGSTRFLNRFANGSGTVDHRGFLTPGELRLISEWIDIGAQYYNNQFDPGVPLNN